MSWTDERVSLLRKLWTEGKTAAEIAGTLGGVTRNAVIGKAHRLKLSNRVSPIQQNTQRSARAAAAPLEKAPLRAARPATPPPVDRPPFKIKGIALVDLKERMCRWPVGDPKEPDFTFCGHDAMTGLVYCAEHIRQAYQAARGNKPMQVPNADHYNGPAAEADDAKVGSG